MFTIPDLAIGTITAAFIAGTISLLSLIISKEQKTSEFRQAWIDALRLEIAEIISNVNAIQGAYTAHRLSTISSGDISAQSEDVRAKTIALWNDVKDNFVSLNTSTAKVRLRLNRDECLSRLILQSIQKIEILMMPGSNPTHTQLNDADKELVSVTQDVLKIEWKRVKYGEPIFRVTGILLITSLLIVISYAIIRFKSNS